ncbi:MAG: radical SAM protein [Thermoplasmata archaeon]
MIALNQILFKYGTVSRTLDEHRFKEETDSSLLRYRKNLATIFWNITFSCNLKCIHCYASATPYKNPNELSNEQIFSTIDDLAAMKLPVIIFSGGEPYMHPDLLAFSSYANSKGIRVTLSSNGTLITDNVAMKMAEAGIKYVGISLDGWKDRNDAFRGVNGAFEKAIRGIKAVKKGGMLSGIRFTVTNDNYEDLDKIFQLSKELEIDRFCVYHLVPVGRGSNVKDIDNGKRREIIDYLIDKAYEVNNEHLNMEILTVDNPADGVYAFLKTYKEDEKAAKQVYTLLKRRGGDNSGIKVADIDPLGNVHPNQFWWDLDMGSVKNKKFSDIWKNSDGTVKELRDNKVKNLKGKCGRCNFKDICGGFRLRALRYNNDIWSEDPDCYLTEAEISTEIPEEWKK